MPVIGAKYWVAGKKWTGHVPSVASFDGAAWARHDSPAGTAKELYSIFALDATHIYVGSYDGEILLYNGTAWSRLTAENYNPGYSIIGIWAADATHIWAVAYKSGAGSLSTVVYFSDGAIWAAVTTSPYMFTKIWGLDISHVYLQNDAWMGIYWWDGASWAWDASVPDVMCGICGSSPGQLILLDRDGSPWRPIYTGSVGSWSHSSQELGYDPIYAQATRGNTMALFAGDAYIAIPRYSETRYSIAKYTSGGVLSTLFTKIITSPEEIQADKFTGIAGTSAANMAGCFSTNYHTYLVNNFSGSWAADSVEGLIGGGIFSPVCISAHAISTPDPVSLTTVTEDLASHKGTQRLYYVMIDGVPDYLCEHSNYGAPAWVDRTPRICLSMPKQVSADLDVGSGWCSLQGLEIRLDDILVNGLRYFSQLLQPAGWTTGGFWTISNIQSDILDADATTIYLDDDTDLPDPWPSSGTLYLGQERISYTGKASAPARITGVSRGTYPAIGEAQGYAYDISDRQPKVMLAEKPLSVMGRRIGLYVTTYDEYTDTWQEEADKVCVWSGRIINKIDYDSSLQQYVLTCESTLQDLDVEVCCDLPVVELVGINMRGNGDTRHVHIDIVGAQNGGTSYWLAYHDFYITQNYYATLEDYVSEFNSKLEGDWTITSSFNHGLGSRVPTLSLYYDAGSSRYKLHQGFSWGIVGNIYIHTLTDGYKRSLAWQPLGVDWGMSYFMMPIDGQSRDYQFPSPACEVYHSCCYDGNGGWLYCKQNAELERAMEDQGDYATTQRAYVISREMRDVSSRKGDGIYVFRYGQKYEELLNDKSLAILACDSGEYLGSYNGNWFDGFVAKTPDDDTPPRMQQAIIPHYNNGTRSVGPFEELLYFLLSSGTEDAYDATYDKLPLCAAGQMQSSLVDSFSFVFADLQIGANRFASRQHQPYIITEGVSLKELITRECSLFGYACGLIGGKITIKRTALGRLNDIALTISDNDRVGSEWLQSSQDIENVINTYSCNVLWDAKKGAFIGEPIKIVDVNSRQALRMSLSADIEHPGITLSSGTQIKMAEALQEILVGRYWRLPATRVEFQVGPHLEGRIYGGMIVRFTTDYLPDPTGTGLLGLSAPALVVSVTWDFSTHLGSITLLLYNQFSYDAYLSPSALVNQSKNDGGFTGGYDLSNHYLYLVAQQYQDPDYGSEEDGEAFQLGDIVDVIERIPAEKDSPQRWDGVEITDEYATAGAKILSLDQALTGFDAAKEYVVEYTSRSVAATTQIANGTWLADRNTLLVASAKAARYQ